MLWLTSKSRDLLRSAMTICTVIIVAGLFSHQAAAQPQTGVEYETRILLLNSETSLPVPNPEGPGEPPLSINEAVFRWILKPDAGVEDFIITANDLEFLELKIDYASASAGDVFVDLIINGVDQSGAPVVVPQEGTSTDRAGDVIWDFEFFDPDNEEQFPNYDPADFNPETDEFDRAFSINGLGRITDFRNIQFANVGDSNPAADGDVFFQLETSLLAGSDYAVVSYEVVDPDGEWDRSWQEAQNYAESGAWDGRVGYLATLTSGEEDQYVDSLAEEAFGNEEAPGQLKQAWVGAYQDKSPETLAGCEAGAINPKLCGWTWVNDEGLIDYSQYSYNPWLASTSEPNDRDGIEDGDEDWLAINLYGRDGWNDSIENFTVTGGFIIEFSSPKVHVTLFVDGLYEGESYETEIIQRTALVSQFTVRNMPVPLGIGTIFDIQKFEQEGNVIRAGLINADFCIAPDPREPFVINGGGKPPKGNGQANGATNNGKDGGSTVYNKGDLPISVLAGDRRGTCWGPLPEVSENDEFQTWEELLGAVPEVISSSYRGFYGSYDATDDGINNPVIAVWLNIGVIRSTAEFEGPVSVVGFGENPVDYDIGLTGELPPACDNPLEYRMLDLGAPVQAFGEWPNVDGLIPETVQCNRSWGMTRRSTHVYPVRLEVGGNEGRRELENLEGLLDGLQATIGEAASFCANSDNLGTQPFGPLAVYMQAKLDAARGFISEETDSGYENAVYSFEDLAQAADGGVPADRTEPFVDAYAYCSEESNYSGAFVARGLNAAFMVFDRFLNRDSFVLYSDSDRYGLLDKYRPDLRE